MRCESYLSWPTISNRLCGRPRLESLEAFLDALFEARGAQVEFVVLYGSMARGDWSRGSDFDVLVALTKDEHLRLFDRLLPFGKLSRDGWVEALPYTLAEIESMFRHFNLLVLAALRDGIVLYDRGPWQAYQARFQCLLNNGLLIQEDRGWSWTEAAERLMASPGADL